MTWQILSVVPVWVIAIVGAILIAVLDAAHFLTWVGIALGVAVIVTFAIQLAIRRKEGFVNRAMASVGGSVIILAAASGLIALLG